MKKIVFICALSASLQPFCLNAGKDDGIYQKLLRDIKQDLEDEKNSGNGSAISRYAWKGVSLVSYALVAKIVADPLGVYNSVLNTMNYALGRDTNKRVKEIQKTANKIKSTVDETNKVVKKNNEQTTKINKTVENTNQIVKDNNKLNLELKNACTNLDKLAQTSIQDMAKLAQYTQEAHKQTTKNLNNIATSIIGAINNSETKLAKLFEQKIQDTQNDIQQLKNYNKNRFDRVDEKLTIIDQKVEKINEQQKNKFTYQGRTISQEQHLAIIALLNNK